MVDVREAARLVDRTPETVRRWAWTGRVTAIKSGNRLLFRRADVLHASRGGDETPASLAEWVERVRAAGVSRSAGSSSKDLVLDDRAVRQEASQDAGR